MLPSKKVLFFLATNAFMFGDTALIDKNIKCGVKDNKCLIGVYQSFINTLAAEGAPEIGLAKIDPMELKDISVSVLGVLNMTLLNGEIHGLKSCVLKNFKNDLEHGKAILHSICDKIIIHGQYTVELFGSILPSSAPSTKTVEGEGNGKITIDKVEIRLEYPFHLEKRDDGIHFKLQTKKALYTFNVLDKAKFEADSPIVGDNELSKVIINYMNENSKLILQTFGKYFFDKAVDIVHIFANKFFETVPVNDFITDDLSSYIKQ